MTSEPTVHLFGFRKGPPSGFEQAIMRLIRGLALCLIVLGCPYANAATYVVPPDEALIGRSDAIVIARGLHSDVQESTARGIETLTLFAVEEVLEGDGS